MSNPTPVELNMNDALGNPVNIGGVYGFSTTKSGAGTVVVGVACKVLGIRVTLDVVSRTSYLYGKPVQSDDLGLDEVVHVNSYHLFPVKL
jgi:hypothetical protein